MWNVCVSDCPPTIDCIFAGFHLLRKVPAFERRNKKMCHYCVLIQKTDNLRRFCIWLVRKWESEISSFLGFCLWREKYLKKIIWERVWQNWIWSVSVYLFLPLLTHTAKGATQQCDPARPFGQRRTLIIFYKNRPFSAQPQTYS